MLRKYKKSFLLCNPTLPNIRPSDVKPPPGSNDRQKHDNAEILQISLETPDRLRIKISAAAAKLNLVASDNQSRVEPGARRQTRFYCMGPAQMLFRNLCTSLFDFLAQGGSDPHANRIVRDISICHELFKQAAPLKWK